jgi:hypothetical protein
MPGHGVGMTLNPRANDLLDRKAGTEIRKRDYCSRSCPAFKICPIMPLAVQPEDQKERRCLISSSGSEVVKRAYRNLFVGGYSGIIEEMRHVILEYGLLIREDRELTPKQKMQYLRTRMKLLLDLSRTIRLCGKIDYRGDNPGNDPVKIDPAGDVRR